jgi:Cell differentiation family, Rcd1-like
METGSELSKTVATRKLYSTVQTLLLEETGLNYVCGNRTAERFFAVATVLANMVCYLLSLLQKHLSVLYKYGY